MVCVYSSLSFCLVASVAVLSRASEPSTDLDDTALPDVDTMMSEASETVSSLAKTADKMEQALSSNQLHHQAHLDKLRAGYTSRLADKDKANADLVEENRRLKRETASLDAGNDRVRKDAKALRGTNEILRSLFTKLAPKIHAAKQFLLAGVNASEAPLLAKQMQVLKEESSSPPSLEKFLEAVRADGGDDQAPSLMQVGGRSTSGATAAMKSRAHATAEFTAEGIVQALSQQVEKIGQAQEEGDLQMKANFIANFEARQLKSDQLLEEQRKLNATKTDAFEEHVDLLAAQKALQAVNGDLLSRMKGISSFALSSTQYVVNRLDMASSAMGANSTQAGGKALLQSAVSTSSKSGDLAWF